MNFERNQKERAALATLNMANIGACCEIAQLVLRAPLAHLITSL